MTQSPPTASNTMATSETRVETPAQRQPEGRYSPPDFKEAEHGPPFWLIVIIVIAMCGSVYGWTVLVENSSPQYELYVAGLAGGSAALTNLCYWAYYIVMTILLTIFVFGACGLVVFLWFWFDSWSE